MPPTEQPEIDSKQIGKDVKAAAKGVAEDQRGRKTFEKSVAKSNKRFGRKADRRKKIAAAKEFMREKFPKPTEAPKKEASSGDIPTDVGDIGWDDPATYDAGMVAPAVAPGLKGLPVPDRDKVASQLDAARYLYSTTSGAIPTETR